MKFQIYLNLNGQKSNKKQRMDFIKYIDAILNTPNLDDKNEFFW